MRAIWQWIREQGENAWLQIRRWWTIISRWNRLAFRGISVIVFGYPLVITLAALIGFHVLIGFLTLLPIMAALCVSWLITQRRYQGRLGAAVAVIFGTAVASDRGPEASWFRRLAADTEDVAVDALRSLRRVLLIYGGIGAYYFFTPTENIGGIAIGIMILMLLMGGSAAESRGWRTAFFWVPLLVIAIVTAVLFSKEPWYQKAVDDAKAAPAEVAPPERFRIELRGLDSEVPAVGKRPCWFYNPTLVGPVEGASLVRYVFEDETEAPVFDEDGSRLPGINKDLRGFKGPAGRVLAVAVTLPGPGKGSDACREYLERQKS